MLDYSQLEKYDPSGMHKVYDKWPQIAKEAYYSDIKPVNFKDVEHIVFSSAAASGVAVGVACGIGVAVGSDVGVAVGSAPQETRTNVITAAVTLSSRKRFANVMWFSCR